MKKVESEKSKKKMKMKLGVSKRSSFSGRGVFHTTEMWDSFGFTVEIQEGLWHLRRAGVLIGIIDTGLCPNVMCIHRDQIKVKRYFKNKEVSAKTFDKNGHGTTCASLAVGRVDRQPNCGKLKEGNPARGGAPGFDVAIFKVPSSLADEDVTAAVESAIGEDPKVNLLSMSFSLEVREPDILYSNTMALVSWLAREKNVLVCACAGNLGPGGTILNQIPWLFCVSGCNSPLRYTTKLILSKSKEEIEGVSANNHHFGKFDYQVVVADKKDTDGRIWLKKATVGDKIVMCRVSSPNELPKHKDIEEANVKGLIAITSNREFEIWAPSIPGVAVTEEQGVRLEQYIKKHKKYAKVKILRSEKQVNPDYPGLSCHSPTKTTPWSRYFNQPNACFMSELIAAAIPQETRNHGQMYEMKSGTSLSTAATCGIAANIFALNQEWSPNAVMSAMMTTTDPMRAHTVEEKMARGNGLINPQRASNPGFFYDCTTRQYCAWLKGLGVEFGNEDLRTIIDSYDIKPHEFILPWNLNHAAFKTALADGVVTCEFRREITYVGKGPARFTYELVNDDADCLDIKVVPEVMELEEPAEGEPKPTMSYTLTVTVPCWNGKSALFAEITWVNQLGDGHRARSPIVIVRDV